MATLLGNRYAVVVVASNSFSLVNCESWIRECNIRVAMNDCSKQP